MKSRFRAVVPHTVMLAASVLLYLAAAQIEAPGGAAHGLGPDSWPKFIIAVMGGLCLYEIVKRLIGSSFTATGLVHGLKNAPDHGAGADDAGEAEVHNGKLAAGIALIAGYVLGVAHIGFFVATGLFLAAFMWIGGFRRPLALALVSLAGTFVLLVVFMRVAYVSLPVGTGPFKTVSLLLLQLIGA